MTSKTVAESRTKLAQIMTPNDANILGKVFGGALLALIDLAASATAQRFSGTVCVTAAFDRVDFHEPIEIGSLVELVGHVNYVGSTSLEITVDVYATELPGDTRKQTNSARVTMVALRNGKPTPVPRLICETHEERIEFLATRLRKELRSKWLSQFDRAASLMSSLSETEAERLVEQAGDKAFSLYEALPKESFQD